MKAGRSGQGSAEGAGLRRSAAAGVCALVLAAGVAGAWADDWPQFRGPRRDGTTAEAGLLASWPEGGPRLVRTVEGLGEGFSSPVIAGGRLFITGKVGDELRVFAFDLEGRPLWQTAAGPAYTKFYPGARSTPTFDAGRLYLVTGLGRLVALEADSGREAWAINVFEAFAGILPYYGAAESVLVDGDRVVCTPGGVDAALVALDKATGRVVWTAGGAEVEAAYGSPILVEWRGLRQVITLTGGGLVGVRADDGRVLWQFRDYFEGGLLARRVGTPLFSDGVVFADAGHYCGGGAVRLEAEGGAVRAAPLWEKRQTSTHLGGYVLREGCLYGHDGRGWACLDLGAGTLRYRLKEIKPAATLWADGRFYALADNGTMHLLEAGPDGGRVVSTFRIPSAGGQTWAYPAIAGGRLYVRRAERLHVYDIRRSSPAAAGTPEVGAAVAPGPRRAEAAPGRGGRP